MIHIEIVETGERRCIEREIWVTTNRNGVVATPHRIKAKGVCDGEQIWSLGELDRYPLARIITRAEYEEQIGKAAIDGTVCEAGMCGREVVA